MSLAYHCDRDGCDIWARQGSDAARDFPIVTRGDSRFHFCSVGCLEHWAMSHSETDPPRRPRVVPHGIRRRPEEVDEC